MRLDLPVSPTLSWAARTPLPPRPSRAATESASPARPASTSPSPCRTPSRRRRPPRTGPDRRGGCGDPQPPRLLRRHPRPTARGRRHRPDPGWRPPDLHPHSDPVGRDLTMPASLLSRRALPRYDPPPGGTVRSTRSPPPATARPAAVRRGGPLVPSTHRRQQVRADVSRCRRARRRPCRPERPPLRGC